MATYTQLRVVHNDRPLVVYRYDLDVASHEVARSPAVQRESLQSEVVLRTLKYHAMITGNVNLHPSSV